MEEEYACFLNELYTLAIKHFRQTDTGRMLNEQEQKINDDIETNLSVREKEFTYSCLETLLNACGKEAEYAYRQGIRDSVALLKTRCIDRSNMNETGCNQNPDCSPSRLSKKKSCSVKLHKNHAGMALRNLWIVSLTRLYFRCPV